MSQLCKLICTIVNSPRLLVALSAFGSAAVLVAALIFQAFGYAPCHLCILQRWPHLVAAVLGVLILVLRLPMVVALLGMIAALTTGGIAVYHSLVERHIVAGPDTCTSGGIQGLSVDQLMANLDKAPLVRCDEIAWQMLGVTMPNLNVLCSLVFAGMWFWAWVVSRR